MNKRVALISGASRGIGKAIALELARRGHSVAVGFHERADAAQATAGEIQRAGGEAFSIQFDVTEPASCDKAAAAVKERCGSLDILVNNAGITDESPALATDDAAWERVLKVCLTGAFNLSRACARFMVTNRWGRIINISSVVASRGGRGQANYAAAKAGLEGLTRALAIERHPGQCHCSRRDCHRYVPGGVGKTFRARVVACSAWPGRPTGGSGRLGWLPGFR
jgi:3-oxoacyl-[acyl-carrier protein] reductase